jgi:hypothetical protein
LFIAILKEKKGWETGLYHPGVIEAIAEPRKRLKSCVTRAVKKAAPWL